MQSVSLRSPLHPPHCRLKTPLVTLSAPHVTPQTSRFTLDLPHLQREMPLVTLDMPHVTLQTSRFTLYLPRFQQQTTHVNVVILSEQVVQKHEEILPAHESESDCS